MVSGVSYQRVGASNELNGLLFKYKIAKAITLMSLAAVIVMAVCSLVFPDIIRGDRVMADEKTSAAEGNANHSGGLKINDECTLPDTIVLATSEDGSYTPPPPDHSLLEAVEYVSETDRAAYCKGWDPKKGFTDEIPYNVDGECGNWQEKYTALHQRRMEQLERIKAGDFDSFKNEQDKPLYISYLCKEVPTVGNRGCGGLADRMSGMISTFFYALLTDRAYLSHWADGNPVPLEVLFGQPHVNWTYDPQEMRTIFDQKDNALLGYQPVDTLNQKYPSLKDIIFPDGPTQDFKDLWTGTYVEARSNRAYIVRTFKESSVYPKILADMGLDKINTFGCLTDYLFRPTIGSRRFINAYKYLFQMKSVLSIGMQIRTDDNAIVNPQWDKNDLKKWDYFLTCANQLAQVKRQPHHKRVVYFLVTDSAKLRSHFVSMNNDRDLAKEFVKDGYDSTSMVVTGLPIEHIEPQQVAKYINVTDPKAVSLQSMTPGVNSALIENWLLGYTDYRLISQQGYGKLAAFHAKSDDSTISMPRVTSKHRAPDCSKPEALTSYDWLSTQWSLG
ncbi:hypothetical protein DFQ28_005327 [Apophysomyces sp. BC1034]|nr:hypothetical protein DFQ30_010158 [Apophysomyces sp. BC1015]KAG0171053.1 hypothetical protein DFQ29_009026 [Apophysomyces sp. BC1021]KAG0188153.1 hypothetical protein DFQ28_005327 [Apophysomyces sp. BC1034]